MRDPMTLNMATGLFASYLKSEKRASAYTCRNYAHSLALFLDFHGNALADMTDFARLEAHDFRRFLAHRRDSGAGASTVKLDLSALKSFNRFLSLRYDVENDALMVMRGPRMKDHLPRPVSADDAAAILTMDNPDAPAWINARDTAIFTLLYGAGLRISECLSLTQADVPLRDDLRIRGKGGRTRLVPVLSAVRAAVAAYCAICPYGHEAGAPLFFGRSGRPLSARVVQLEMKKRAKALGLPDSATPHALRHTFATHLLSGGGDLRAVQELLGHRSIAATQRYTRIDERQLVNIHRRAHPRGS